MQQPDMVQGRVYLGKPPAEMSEGGLGEVRAPIFLAMGSESQKQQPDPTAYLQDSSRMQFEDARNRRLCPLAHLFLRNWLAVVTRDPPGEVKRRIQGMWTSPV